MKPEKYYLNTKERQNKFRLKQILVLIVSIHT